MKRIGSRENPVIKECRSLKEKKYRQRYGRYIIEGHKLVREALSSGQPLQVMVREDCEAIYWDAEQARPDIEWYCLEEQPFNWLADVSQPQGVLAVMPLAVSTLDELPRNSASGIWLYLDRISDPGNLGTIYRSALALGAGAVLHSKDCADSFSPKTVRAAAGAMLNLPLAIDIGLNDLRELKEQGFQLLATDIGDAEPYYMCSYQHPVILAVGSEAHGLDPEVKSLCEQAIAIPMQQGSDSLNAAVAAAIILADHARRHIICKP